LDEQDVFERGLQQFLLLVGKLVLEQAAGGLVKVVGLGLQLAAQAIDQATTGAAGVGAGAEQVGFEAFAFRLFELQG
jgi:hypothetical protein